MPRCPECEAEIDYLRETTTTVSECQYRLSGEREFEDTPDSNSEFTCPECGSYITDNDEDADAFLDGDWDDEDDEDPWEEEENSPRERI